MPRVTAMVNDSDTVALYAPSSLIVRASNWKKWCIHIVHNIFKSGHLNIRNKNKQLCDEQKSPPIENKAGKNPKLCRHNKNPSRLFMWSEIGETTMEIGLKERTKYTKPT